MPNPSALTTMAAQLNEAVRTLAALPDPDARFLAGMRGHWPAVLDTPAERWAAAMAPIIVEVGRHAGTDLTTAQGFAALEARRERPTPAAVDRMIPTLLWLRWLQPRQRRLIWWRALDWPWWRIASRLRSRDSVVEGWYWVALGVIHARLVDAGLAAAYSGTTLWIEEAAEDGRRIGAWNTSVARASYMPLAAK